MCLSSLPVPHRKHSIAKLIAVKKKSVSERKPTIHRFIIRGKMPQMSLLSLFFPRVGGMAVSRHTLTACRP
jgi:hypothetical protein